MSSSFEHTNLPDLKLVTGSLNQYVINKKLREGLKDKKRENYDFFHLLEDQKSSLESDCAICFSSESTHNNPIIYCSEEK